MTSPLKIAAFGSLLLAWNCAYVSPPIRLEGQPGALEILAGKWSGAYEGDGPNARGGTIQFSLIAGEGHAHGDVLMIPRGSNRAYERYSWREPGMPPTTFPTPPETITIKFVRVEDDLLMGMLDPYWDPDRECQVTTTFVGHVEKNEIHGTFRSSFDRPSFDATGRWSVTRQLKR